MSARNPYAPLFDLHGKVALVTGGARGIGRGAVLALARQGADVAVNYVGHAEEAEATRDLVRKMGRRALAVKADVSDRAQVEAMVATVARELGRLDVVVSNAGVAGSASLLDLAEEQWDRLLAINLKGQFLVGQAAAREMVREGRGGRIVNVSSIGSGGVGVGFLGAAHYTASKGGILGLTETMALELAPRGITVNAVCPGVIDTDMTKPFLAQDAAAKAFLARIPLGRTGRAEEVGALIAFLASDEAAYCTGAAFYVDGGWLAG